MGVTSVLSGHSLPTFRWNLLLPSSEQNSLYCGGIYVSATDVNPLNVCENDSLRQIVGHYDDGCKKNSRNVGYIK
jgi:hypothetical protein